MCILGLLLCNEFFFWFGCVLIMFLKKDVRKKVSFLLLPKGCWQKWTHVYNYRLPEWICILTIARAINGGVTLASLMDWLLLLHISVTTNTLQHSL